MKLIILLLTTAILQVSASTYGQNITLKKSNASLVSVFTEIRKQTGYDFFYSDKMMDSAKPINLNVKNAPLEQVLKQVFAGQPLDYELKGNSVMVKEKESSFLDKVIARFQAIDVRGKVVDSLGNGLAGATVSVKGGKGSTSTLANGDFVLKNVDEGVVLVFSYLGYVTKEVPLNREFMYVTLQQSSSKLDEVQIQAYSVTSRRLSTGNIGSVKAEDIAKQPVNNPLLALAGRIPGLEITQSSGYSGSAVKVRVQGTNSINGNNDPFYVVDGVPYPSSLLTNLASVFGSSGNSATYGSGNPLSYINPQDIESIEVLKDASATAIYGSRAANGAVLITTKKGKVGQSKVDINVQSGFGQVARKQKLLNTQQYLEMRREAYANDGVDFITTFPYGGDASTKEGQAADLFLFDQSRYTDWQKELIGNTARYNDAQLSLSGGSPNVQYRASGAYHKETTVFPGDKGNSKGSVAFSLNTVSTNQKLRFSLGGNYMMDNSDLSATDLTSAAMTLAPNTPSLYNPDGSLYWGTSTFTFANPLADYNRLYGNKTSNLIGNANLSYELIPGLIFRSTLGYNKLESDEISTLPFSAIAPPFRSFYERTASYGMSQINSWIVEPQITYTKLLGEGKLQALLGSSIQQTNSERKQLNGRKYKNDLVLEDITAAESVTAPQGSSIVSEYKYSAVFGRLNYNLQDKYIVELNARRDGSSRFGSENRFHNFAALSGAWIFSNENFIKDNFSFFSFGKLRASYGTTGSDQIGDYKYLSLYYNNNVEAPYAGTQGLQSFELPNSFLQWEQTRKLSIGLDLGFMQDRFLLNATYFVNRSSNQLLFYTLPPSTGFSGISSNFPATVQNSGLEISLNTTNIRTKDFNWSTNFNFTIPDNKLVSFPNLAESAYAKELKVGQSIVQSQKLYKFSNIDPTTGIPQYIDKNGNFTSLPMDEADNNYLRFRAGQLLYGGLQNSFSYKGFSLDVLLSYVKQNGLNNFYGVDAPGLQIDNQPITVLNRWQNTGDVKPIGKYSATDFMTYFPNATISNSDAAWKDASYVRLKNLSLSWQLPESWRSKAHLQNARLYIQGQNLFTITNYEGLDPESLSSSTLPPLRVFTLGIQLTL